ncbi:MAG TPA: geranylgeranylglycerol-phosphate geranylgeranyltransferase [bacterium]|nr:geranylgeranylglycerol-phosphate geranylgeranyltransferase [bacterium]
MMNKVMAIIRNYLELARPLNLFQAALAILVGYWLVQNPSIDLLIFTMLTVLTFTAGGNAINDYFDLATDRINKPERVIPSGRISRNAALTFAIVMFVIGLLAMIPILNFYTAIIGISALILLIIYTPVLKNLVIIGNLAVSLILGVAFIFTTAVFNQPAVGIIPAGLAFGFNFIREIIKDMEDVSGDSSRNINTLPAKYGKQKAKYLVLFGIILIFTGIPLPFVLGNYGRYYLWTVLLTVEIPLIYVFVGMLSDISKQNCAKMATILKYDIFFGLIAVFLGKF